ncbi:MAG: HEAT repeat domain-containing protein [Thermodesulfobacteriota bacterium]
MKPLADRADLAEQKALEEEVKSTKALIQTFLQTLKAFRLYEPNHPLLSKFQDRLKHDFESYFNEFDSFSLQVGEHQLFYSGKVIYQSEDIKESLAFVFFKDGIREIRFFKGIEFREIVDFLQIVRKSDSISRFEDDLVTLIWERNFVHIAITTLDDFAEGSTVFVPATPEDLIKGLEYSGFGKEGAQEKILIDENIKETMSSAPGMALAQTFQLTPNEIMALNQEIQAEQEPEHLYVLIDHLTEILLHLGEEREALENLVSYCDRILESLLRDGDLERTVAILMKLREIRNSLREEHQRVGLEQILERSTKPHFILLVGEALKKNPEMEPSPILQYLQFLTPQAIGPLCQVLGRLESNKWRKIITDLLIELSRADIQPLIPFLSDRNPNMVRQILTILERINHPSTWKYLGSLVGHPDPKLREATLQMLTQFGEKSKDLVLRFLKDPVAEIRARASIVLARMAKQQAAKPLMEIILSEEFYKRDYEEKASFFRALGETGSQEVIPILQKIAAKRNFFSKGKWEEMRVCANNTLRMMGAQACPR